MHIFGSRVDFVRRRADNNNGINGLHAGTCYQSASFINYDLTSLVINVPYMQMLKVWKQVKMFWLIKEHMECLKKKALEGEVLVLMVLRCVDGNDLPHNTDFYNHTSPVWQ